MNYTILIHETHPKVKEALSQMLSRLTLSCKLILTDSEIDFIDYLQGDCSASLDMLVVETKVLDDDKVYNLLRNRNSNCQLILLNTFLDETYYKTAKHLNALALLFKTSDISFLQDLIFQDIDNKREILTQNTIKL